MAAVTLLPRLRNRFTCLPDQWLHARATPRRRLLGLEHEFPGVKVTGPARDIRVKFASTEAEWEQAFRMAAVNYQARGYEPAGPREVRFTPYHMLPETVTLVAKVEERVVATLSLVMDNTLLGLPLEAIYEQEVAELRGANRRIGEVSNFADCGLRVSEFVPVLLGLITLAWQHHLHNGGDLAVVCCTPRHGLFYQRALGFTQLGPPRRYPWVQNITANGLRLDPAQMLTRAPTAYWQVFGMPLSDEALHAPPMPRRLMAALAHRSPHFAPGQAAQLLRQIECGRTRRW